MCASICIHACILTNCVMCSPRQICSTYQPSGLGQGDEQPTCTVLPLPVHLHVGMMSSERGWAGEGSRAAHLHCFTQGCGTGPGTSETTRLRLEPEPEPLKNHRFRFRTDLAALPHTQVSVERLFSAMKILLTDLRSKMKHDIVEAILFLKSNQCV